MIDYVALFWGRVRPTLQIIRRYDIAILLVLAALTVAYLWFSPIHVYNLTVEDSLFPAQGEVEISNSYRPTGNGNPRRTLTHRAEFEYNAFSQDIMHVRTLDCSIYARLNGEDMLPHKVSGNLCDDYNGAYFDISELAVEGTNLLEIKTRHTRNSHIVYFGFDVSSANLKSPTYLAFVSLLIIIIFYCVFTRLIRSKLPLYALGILLVAILVRVYVVSNTHALERSHDVYGHLEYMNILIENKSLPQSDECWSCYHPPYYFATMATIKSFLTAMGLTEFNVYQFMMLISVATYTIALFFGFLTIRRFFIRPSLQIFAMGLYAFLPSSVIHSVAINNDLWMVTLFSVAFYFFVVWWQTKVTRFFYISLAFASLSVIAKTSGIVIFALLGFYALGYALAHWREFFTMVKRFTPAVVIMGGALLVNPIVDKTLRPASDNPTGGIISNSEGLSSALVVGNEARNYLYFDPMNFINRPFIDPLEDESGRQYFWTALFKTALYAEFRDHHAYNEGSRLRNAIAPLISFAFLVLLLYMIVHAFVMRRENMAFFGPLYALVTTCLAALILMRMLIPSFPINDFRYIWTIMIAPSILVPLAVDTCRQRNLPMLSYIGYGAMSVSVILSILFTLSMN